MQNNLFLVPVFILCLACLALSFANHSLGVQIRDLDARVQALEAGSRDILSRVEEFDKAVKGVAND